MALMFLSHNWEVKNFDNGILVTLTQHELDSKTVWILVDELFELARESAETTLYVDFRNVRDVSSVVFGKLITLDKRLREIDCRLVLSNVKAFVYQQFRSVRLTENLDIRPALAEKG